MTSLWTSDDIADACGGTAHGDFAVGGVTFDSREVGPGDLFVALKGEATDGHRFVDPAIAAGAAGLLVDRPVDGPHVLVPDTMRALEALGVAARARTGAKVIGVTGSVGKTTTKEALFAALDRADPGRVHRSVKSYNNHTGVPLSLARMPLESAYAVLEMGMNHAGELAALTRMVRPHVALVTAIASAHRAFFDTEEAIADAKGEIFEGLEPGGTAIIPYDSPHRDRLRAAAEPYAASILSFGTGDGADVRALYAIPSGTGTIVTAKVGEAQLSFTVGQPGQHMVANALAVLAAVEAVGGDLAAAGLALAELGGLKGRGERHRIAVAGGEALLIDESYNANPASMAATLAVLGDEPVAGKRIAVLGAMKELGDHSDPLHAGLAEPVRAAGLAHLILVGDEMAALESALNGSVDTVRVGDASAAAEALSGVIGSGDAVLIKGSNSLGLGRLVAELTGERG